MCISCRNFLKTKNDHPAIVFLNDDNEIESYGIKTVDNKKVYTNLKDLL